MYQEADMDTKVEQVYGNKVRVRACGFCWDDDNRLLMVNHKGITPTDFWCPPGGGVEFGQSLDETLKKEFREETGLLIKPGDFMFGCEYIENPIHSVELFYHVEIVGGKLRTGFDPEIQIIDCVQFMDFSAIKQINSKELHGIFRHVKTPDDIKKLSGFYRI
jgi:8-oxo-dGTP diphosphatase